MKLELVIIPVSDVEVSKKFYTEQLGFHEDIDQVIESFRFVQLTPPGSSCSISFGTGVTKAKPGSIDSLLLVVKDIQNAHDELLKKGIKVSKVEMMPWGSKHIYFSDPDGNKWTLQEKPLR